MSTSRPLKILLSAYACRPGEGSEPAIGWNLAQGLVQQHQVWILTRESNRPAITAALEEQPCPGLTVLYCDLPPFLQPLQLQRKLVHLHYYYWQILAYQQVRQLYSQVGWDCIHHVTYVKYWSPSFLALLPVPFIWGPVGGGEVTPAGFRSTFSLRGQFYELLRDVARGLGELDPFVKLTAQRSEIAFATTEQTAQRLRALGAKRVEVLSQLALSGAEFELRERGVEESGGRVILSIGRLLHWKGFHLGLEAFARADIPETIEYWLIGEGPEKERLLTLAHTFGLGERVKFCGKLPRGEVLSLLQQGLALLHPSLHESGGMVCLEAMAVGCPVICLDLGGPGLLVTPETGYKIPAVSPRQAIADLAQAITTVAQNPQQRQALGEAAQQRVQRDYTMQAKLAQFNCYATLRVCCATLRERGASRSEHTALVENIKNP
ncbi:glycosyltransferase family 4 protein [Spirulina subsalsa]|uniref:glycosyltransferase family 4 protein n=1 Tax=Spirulina subsalsa TaxID=54311 RepID=UPI0002FE962E|nr:glycosyltransferase family 4 protein [Spirulina subsalsa]